MKEIPKYSIIRILDEYSQLGSFKGSKELFFVRHAGEVQHSDPTIRKGWGLYFWDAGTPEIPGSWRKIAEQEGMDIIPDQFVSKEEFQAISDRVSTLNAELNDVKQKFETFAANIASIPKVSREDLTLFELLSMVTPIIDAAKTE